MLKFFTVLLAAFLIWQVGGEFFSDPPPTPSPNGTIPMVERRQVILFTGSDWCSACVHLEKTILKQKAWKQFQNKEIRMNVIDVGRRGATAGQEAMLKQYRVQGFPTMIVTNAAGKELGRKVGVTGDLNHYVNWIRIER